MHPDELALYLGEALLFWWQHAMNSMHRSLPDERFASTTDGEYRRGSPRWIPWQPRIYGTKLQCLICAICLEKHPGLAPPALPGSSAADKYLKHGVQPGLRGPLHTRDWEPVSITLQALSLVEKAGSIQVHVTLRLRDQRSIWMQDGCKVFVDSYMASHGSCCTVTWTIFKNHLLEVGRTHTQSGDYKLAHMSGGLPPPGKSQVAPCSWPARGLLVKVDQPSEGGLSTASASVLRLCYFY